MYKGLSFTWLNVFPTYIPTIPKTIIMRPPKNHKDIIVLAQPGTIYPVIKALANTTNETIKEILEIIKPAFTASFKGLSEKDNIISMDNDIKEDKE